MRPTHRQLEYLVAVTETGHFGAAARNCNVTQPTLSAQIQLLEDRLKSKLIERTPRGARPTPLGDIVVKLSRDALSILDEIKNVTRDANADLGGSIRLATLPTIGPYYLPLLLPPLHTDYPGLEISFREERPSQLEQALLAGSFDCALTRRPKAEGPIFFRELIAEPMLLGIPSDHHLAEQPVIRPEMLSGERMLNLGADFGMPDTIREFFSSVDVKLCQAYEGTNFDGLSQLVSIGKGISLFPKFYVSSNLHGDSRIVLREIEGANLTRSVGLAWREGSARGQQYEELSEQFKKTLEGACKTE